MSDKKIGREPIRDPIIKDLIKEERPIKDHRDIIREPDFKDRPTGVISGVKPKPDPSPLPDPEPDKDPNKVELVDGDPIELPKDIRDFRPRPEKKPRPGMPKPERPRR